MIDAHKQEFAHQMNSQPATISSQIRSTKRLYLKLGVQHHHVEEVVREGERHGRSCQQGAAGRAEEALFQPAGHVAAWRAALPYNTGVMG